MGETTESKLLRLARKLKELDKRIVKGTIKGEEWSKWVELRVEFTEMYRKIKEILGNASPLQLRDPKVRDTLKKVREGRGFSIDKDRQSFLKLIELTKRADGLSWEQKRDLLKDMGEIAPYFGLWDFDYDDPQFKIDIEEDIRFQIPAEEYLKRKNEFSTIILSTHLPDTIHSYFHEIRECFLFGQTRAVVGLCRVLLELAFRDKFEKLGLDKGRTKQPKVSYMDNYRNGMGRIIRDVCKTLRSKSLQSEAQELYGTSCNILHGKEISFELEETEVLAFVRRIFRLIETLY